MVRRSSLVFAIILAAGQAFATGTTVQFSPGKPEVGPFPTDALTVTDAGQKTGVRINLPKPDCQAQPSTCAEIGLINELDGFSLNPRVAVRFSGKIILDTLRQGIWIVWLDNLTQEESGQQPQGHITKINEVEYDLATNTAYAKPDEILDQHRRYALVVTSAIKDEQGGAVDASPDFNTCVAGQDGYCGQLRKVVDSLQTQFAPNNIVAASIFTTLSATAWLEKARDQLVYTSPGYWPIGSKNVFRLADLKSITYQEQTQSAPSQFQRADMSLLMLNGIGRIAFGSFYSPNFLDDHMMIPAVPTGKDVALPFDFREIPFVVFLPDQPAPPGGYPVVIAGQGASIIDLDWATWVASAMLAHGFAVISFNTVGWGPGPESYLMVNETGGKTTRIPYPGRAVDMSGDGTYVQGAGCYVEAGPHPVQNRDCFRQTALDLLQLVRMIKGGVDLDGNGTVDLDSTRMYYSGYSMGAMHGTLFTALSPDLKASVLNSAAGLWAEAEMWSGGVLGRSYPVTLAGARTPSLLNRGDDLDFDSVLRDQPVHVISVSGALEIQDFVERVQWSMMPGDAIAYAPHLKPSPLHGMSVRNVMFQFSKGDHVLPNPFESALVRTAGMPNAVSLYRHDLARTVVPALFPEGHLFMWPNGPWSMTNPLAQYLIFTMALEQQAGFFASDGKAIPDVNMLSQYWFGQNLFETPPSSLPDGLNY